MIGIGIIFLGLALLAFAIGGIALVTSLFTKNGAAKFGAYAFLAGALLLLASFTLCSQA